MGGDAATRGDVRLLMYLTLPPMRTTRELSGRLCISLCRLDSYSGAEMPGVSSSLLTGREKNQNILVKMREGVDGLRCGCEAKTGCPNFGGLVTVVDNLRMTVGNMYRVRMSYLRPSSGFHPSLVSCLPLPSLPSSCSLHALYSLPPHLFVDPNELTDDHNLAAAVDLEAPVFNVDQRSTHILYNITENTAHFYQNGTVCFNLPIHARYGTPSISDLYLLSIDCPRVFSSCPRSGEFSLSLSPLSS